MKSSSSIPLDDEKCTSKKRPCTSNEEGKNNYMISSFRQRRPNLNPDPSSTIPPNYNLREVVMEQKSDIDPYYYELFEEENVGGGGDSIDVSKVGKAEEEEVVVGHDVSNKRNSKRRGADVSIEEDIGLNEAMLESLHVKLISLEEEIAHERYVVLL